MAITKTHAMHNKQIILYYIKPEQIIHTSHSVSDHQFCKHLIENKYNNLHLKKKLISISKYFV